LIIVNNRRQNKIHLRWRDKDGKRMVQDIDDFNPYFFIEADEARPESFSYHKRWGGQSIRRRVMFTYDSSGSWEN